MSLTMLSLFFSTCMLIDADINVTKYGMQNGFSEANPVAAMWTSQNDWSGLKIAALSANTAAFLGLGALGKAVHGDILSAAWQVLYVSIIFSIEVYALSAWNSIGVPVEVSVKPLLVLW